MYATNARLLFTALRGIEPDVTEFLGYFPEDSEDPTHYLFSFSYDTHEGNVTEYVVVELSEDQALTRFCDEKEVEAIKTMQVPIKEPEANVAQSP